MQLGIARMFISTEDLEWQSELDHANRAFAAMIGGQRYENITREEAKRLVNPKASGDPGGRRGGLDGASLLCHMVSGTRWTGGKHGCLETR
jgi:hypothetical protein